MSDINMQTTQNYKKNCMAGYNAISSNVYANNHNDNKELPEEDNNLSPGAATVTADVVCTYNYLKLILHCFLGGQ